MAFFRKAGSILGRTVSNHISQEISLFTPSIFQAIRCMSSSKLFIGGLSYSTDDTSLTEAFNKYGEVAEARVIVDRETGRSRGFGFVTFSSIEEASAAIQALDQQELHGRRIRVDYANDRTRGYGGGGFRGGNFGGGGGGFGGGYGAGGGYSNDGYGGNYGGGGYGGSSNHNPGINSYGSGTGTEGSSNYASNNGYGGGNLSYGGDGQNFGVAGGAGGNDNFFSGGAGAGSTSGTGGYDGFGDKFGNEQNKNEAGADGGLAHNKSLEGNYVDDNDTRDNYADRRS
ncbi:Alternative splicing factor SRp20/9G8 (RRM superfamily) [Handroanthus impetiginosus]|uniref:Alternative splicing factor SRp20/9G8 (RRM superfamily) n=1 Tax=Handroanthus impetiginosus TaxID=429701 RepID=A0A2G9G219_9LAMI|nr:Alternative splicing factor SRp20/9G8 (RRM superfamily) [Handroanthus impetiginosus]